MEDFEVHECDLFEHEPYAVDCLALDERKGILSVARHSDFADEKRDGIIEFWNVIGTPMFYVRSTFLGTKTAESLLWKSDILLAAHLDGSITGHRLHTSEYFTVRLTPSPLWCLASITGSAFCAGSGSGAVLILSLEENNHIALNKTVSIGFSTHVMSLACNNDIIAAGTIDEISLISVSKQQIEYRMKLPRIEKRKPTVVWCLCFIGDLLASGDSRGYVTFWNASNGAFSQCLQTHQSDILSITVMNQSLYAAGVDPTIARLGLNQENTAYRVEHRRTIHSNDVRALITCNVVENANFFFYQYDSRIVIWKAGKPTTVASEKKIHCLAKGPVKLAQLRSYRGEFIVSSALNSEGKLLAVSTISTTTIYKLDLNSSKELNISVLNRMHICGTRLLFTSTSLFIASGCLRIYGLPIGDSIPQYPDVVAERDNAGEVVRLHSNMNEMSLVLLTARNELFILGILKKTLRKLEIPGTNIFIDAQFISLASLYILCADRKYTLIEYNTDTNILSDSTISTEALCMLPDESVLQMDCNSSNDVVLSGSRGSFRVIAVINGKRVLLYGPEACALKKTEEDDGVCLMRRDRCSQAFWLSARKLLFTTPIMFAEPSQTAFRLKRYGLN
uniref:WD_REPEATS_REGION domain-containing protein n=1 Tax=Wuchereria bancrofti TaxID=6293 RepID=A0A1I8EHQ7_WUCBA